MPTTYKHRLLTHRSTMSPIVKDCLIFNDHSQKNGPFCVLSTDEALCVLPHADRAAEVSSDSEGETCAKQSVSRGGVVTPFPWKLHDMLENVVTDGFVDYVSWQPHGRAFAVKDATSFVNQVLPIYFNQSKFASFQRQLNLYGFRRFTKGEDKGCYFHEWFLRGKRALCHGMSRQKVKGTKVRRALQSGMEPDLYRLPFLPWKQNDSESRVLYSPVTTQDFHGTILTSQVKSPTTPVLSAMSSDEKEIPVFTLEADKKTGDVLFFEGQPFHYLDSHTALSGKSQWDTVLFSTQVV